MGLIGLLEGKHRIKGSVSVPVSGGADTWQQRDRNQPGEKELKLQGPRYLPSWPSFFRYQVAGVRSLTFWGQILSFLMPLLQWIHPGGYSPEIQIFSDLGPL